MNLLSFFRDHFQHAAPILIAAIFAIGIVVDRYRSLFKTFSMDNADAFLHQCSDLIRAGKVAEVVELCDRFPEKLHAKIVKTAAQRAHLPETLIEDGISIEMSAAIEKIQKRTAFLGMIANVVTLLGLLGTVAGLIASFEAVGAADPQQKSSLLAAGISTAMNATMLGLAVAIPSMVAFSIFMNRSNRLIAELEQAGIRMLDAIKQRIFSTESEDKAAS